MHFIMCYTEISRLTDNFKRGLGMARKWHTYIQSMNVHVLVIYRMHKWQIEGLAQDYGNSSALVIELLQSSAKPLIYL